MRDGHSGCSRRHACLWSDWRCSGCRIRRWWRSYGGCRLGGWRHLWWRWLRWLDLGCWRSFTGNLGNLRFALVEHTEHRQIVEQPHECQMPRELDQYLFAIFGSLDGVGHIALDRIAIQRCALRLIRAAQVVEHPLVGRDGVLRHHSRQDRCAGLLPCRFITASRGDGLHRDFGVLARDLHAALTLRAHAGMLFVKALLVNLLDQRHRGRISAGRCFVTACSQQNHGRCRQGVGADLNLTHPAD